MLLVAGPLLVFGDAFLQAGCYGVARAVLPILTRALNLRTWE